MTLRFEAKMNNQAAKVNIGKEGFAVTQLIAKKKKKSQQSDDGRFKKAA